MEIKEKMDALISEANEIRSKLEDKELKLSAEELNSYQKRAKEISEEHEKLLAEYRNEIKDVFDKTEKERITDKPMDEKRALDFKNTGRLNRSISSLLKKRSILSTGKIAKPSDVDGIDDNFQGAYGILNEFRVMDAGQVSEIKLAYMKTRPSLAAETEGSAPTENSPTFDYVTLTPKTRNGVVYISKAIDRYTPLDYERAVLEEVIPAMLTDAEETAIAGFGACQDSSSTKMVQAIAIQNSTGAIDQDTLRTILINFKRGENVRGTPTLFLTQAQLVEFGKVRGTNEKRPLYAITFDPNNSRRGTLSEGGSMVNFVICTGITKMILGQLDGYTLALWGDYRVEVDGSYKFAEGLNTVRYEYTADGSVRVPYCFAEITLSKAGA